MLLIYSIFFIFSVLIGFLILQFLNLKKRLDILSAGENKDLESTLKTLLNKSKSTEKMLEDIIGRINFLEKTAKISFQKTGLVRYNPFKDTGGDQSFSLALLDSGDSGFVITSLYIKEGRSKVFTKPIKQGKSEYLLSEEEKKAIEKARGF